MRFLSQRVGRIFAYGKPVDLRKGFTGLQALVQSQLGDDPLGGDLFVFFNRRGNLLKCLLWDRTGFVIVAKRLEQGKFRLRSDGDRLELDERRLSLLFDGLPVGGIKAEANVPDIRGPLPAGSFSQRRSRR